MGEFLLCHCVLEVCKLFLHVIQRLTCDALSPRRDFGVLTGFGKGDIASGCILHDKNVKYLQQAPVFEDLAPSWWCCLTGCETFTRHLIGGRGPLGAGLEADAHLPFFFLFCFLISP